jgi:methylated-DNA-[protein]-cysteine S-methyltransferase
MTPTPLLLSRESLPTPIGTLVILTDCTDCLRVVDWEDHQPRMLCLLRRQYQGQTPCVGRRARPSAAREALKRYFEGDLDAFAGLSTSTGGTAFQREVWRQLRTIPAGQTITYGTLAGWLGRPRAARAAGLANGANPIGVAVPCHRVIGADGSLTGYGGGLERKRWLLRHEGAW